MGIEANIEDHLKKLATKIDQMISQHSYLRDYYKCKSNVIDITIMSFSLILSVLVFADKETLINFIPCTDKPQIMIGLISIIILLLSIINWKIDWKRSENSHEIACNILSELKHKFNSILNSDKKYMEDNYQKAVNMYQTSLSKCCPIPESKFNITKRHHLKKVALSKAISNSPSANIFIVKFKLWFQDTLR